MALPTIAELEAQLARCDKLKEKPKRVYASKPVTQAEYDANPDDYILVGGGGRGGLAHRCTAQSRQKQRRCKRAVSPGMQVCHNHGGKNRGPTSPEGLTRCAAVRTVHGKATRQGRRDHQAAYARGRVLGKATNQILAHERKLRRMIRDATPA